MDTEVLYSADQINVPEELGIILKEYTKQVIRNQPEDLYRWSADYFAQKAGTTLEEVEESMKSDEENNITENNNNNNNNNSNIDENKNNNGGEIKNTETGE